MDVQQIRTSNLRELLKNYESDTEFALLVDVGVAHCSILKTGNKPMGNMIARRIEKRLGLMRGWMDQVHQPADMEKFGQEETLNACERADLVTLMEVVYKKLERVTDDVVREEVERLCADSIREPARRKKALHLIERLIHSESVFVPHNLSASKQNTPKPSTQSYQKEVETIPITKKKSLPSYEVMDFS
jgi:hypothetical protein